MKEYRNMESGEQTQWLKLFSAFLANDYVVVKAMGDGWIAAFERGLKVLEPMTMCQRFVQDARTYRDFDRRVKRMAFFIEELRKQVLEVDGSLLAKAMAAPPKRRVGRPTKKEQMQKQMENALKASGKIEAMNLVAGKVEENMTGDLFGNEETGTRNEELGVRSEELGVRSEELGVRSEENQDQDQNENENEGGKAVRLQDIKGLLSGELQEKVDGLALLRGEAARMSENAKEAALAGKSQDVVAGYAQKAAELTEEVETIYRLIDEDLARKYIRARMCKETIFEGMKREDVLAQTEYYCKKVCEANPAFEGQYIARLAAEQAIKTAQTMGIQEVDLIIKGPGPGRESAIRAVQGMGMKVRSISDITPVPHNGCRPPKKRRV